MNLVERTAHHRITVPFGASSCLLVGALAPFGFGCAAPQTTVVVDNDYPAESPLVVYRASWQAVSVSRPIAPGASSGPQDTVPASANTAYVLLAPGWDPTSAASPSSLVVMQSRGGFGVSLNDALHIPIDDTTFLGNCASGSFLSQAQADFITGLVFPTEFAGSSYDAATCTTISAGDAGKE